MREETGWAEPLRRCALLLMALAPLVAATGVVVFEHVREMFRERFGPLLVALLLLAALMAFVIAAGLDLSFAGRERVIGRARRRYLRNAARVAWTGVTALLTALPIALWTAHLGLEESYLMDWWWFALRASSAFVVLGVLGITAAAVLAGIANRLAIRALERRRADRDWMSVCSSGSDPE